ncbi:hypothetical protein FGB62_261g02 [Gracilaria domingensis]|nr:hypothetical protein FGB62_261g02 [Gracilaria domingensis]
MDDGGGAPPHSARRQRRAAERRQRVAKSLRRLYSHPFVDPRLPHGPHGRLESTSPAGGADGADGAAAPDKAYITWAVFNNLVSEQLGVRPQRAAEHRAPPDAFQRYLRTARAVAVKPSLTERSFVTRLASGYDTALLADSQKLKLVATDPLQLPRDLHGAHLVHQRLQRLNARRRADAAQAAAAAAAAAKEVDKLRHASGSAATQPDTASPSQLSPVNATDSPRQTDARQHRVTRSAAKKLAAARTASQCCFCPDLAAFGGKELASELIGPFVDRRGHARLFVHFECACWAPQVYADAASGQLRRVYDEHCRGRQLKCAHCGDRGATIGCYVQRCKRVYHLRCLRISGAYTVERFFAAFCLKHAQLGKEQTYVTLMEAGTIADVAAAQRRDDTTFGLDAPHSRFTMLRRRETEVVFSRKWRICSHPAVYDSTKVLFSHKRRRIVSRRDKLFLSDRVKALRASAVDVASGRLTYLAVLGEDALKDDAAAFKVRAALAARDVSSLLLLRNLRHAPEWKKEDIRIVKKLVPPVDRNQNPVAAGKAGESESKTNSDGNGRPSRPKRTLHGDTGEKDSEKDMERSLKRPRTTSLKGSEEDRSAEVDVIQTIPLQSARLPPIKRKEKSKEQDEAPEKPTSSPSQEEVPIQETTKEGIEHVTKRSTADIIRDTNAVSQQEVEAKVSSSWQRHPRRNPGSKPKSAWEIFLERQLPKERMLRPQDSMEDSMRSMARLWSLMSPTEREEYEHIARKEAFTMRESEGVQGQDNSRQRKSIANIKGRYASPSHSPNVTKAGLFVKSNVSTQNPNNSSISSVPYGNASGKQKSKSLPPIRRHSIVRTDPSHAMDWDELFPTSLRGILPGKDVDSSDGSRLVSRVRPPPGHGKSVT